MIFIGLWPTAQLSSLQPPQGWCSPLSVEWPQHLPWPKTTFATSAKLKKMFKQMKNMQKVRGRFWMALLMGYSTPQATCASNFRQPSSNLILLPCLFGFACPYCITPALHDSYWSTAMTCIFRSALRLCDSVGENRGWRNIEISLEPRVQPQPL